MISCRPMAWCARRYRRSLVHPFQHVPQPLQALRPEGAVAVDPIDQRIEAAGLDPVIGMAPLAPLAHEARPPQGREMLRDCRLRHREIRLELADAHLAQRQPLIDGTSRRIGESPEDVGFDHVSYISDGLCVWQAPWRGEWRVNLQGPL